MRGPTASGYGVSARSPPRLGDPVTLPTGRSELERDASVVGGGDGCCHRGRYRGEALGEATLWAGSVSTGRCRASFAPPAAEPVGDDAHQWCSLQGLHAASLATARRCWSAGVMPATQPVVHRQGGHRDKAHAEGAASEIAGVHDARKTQQTGRRPPSSTAGRSSTSLRCRPLLIPAVRRTRGIRMCWRDDR